MTYAPLIKSIVVPCSQEEAFTVFIDELGTWWPLDRFSASIKRGLTPASLRVDARAGGQIVETSEDGTEHLWGTITEYSPYAYLRMDLHIGLPPETASLVELRFTALADERTRVELTQREWERFGEFAEMMMHGYPRGWAVIFDQAYLRACGG